MLWRIGRKAQIVTLAVGALASFALAVHGWRVYPEASFYLPSSRAWELLAGRLIADVPPPASRVRPGRHAGRLVALILPLLLFDKHMPSASVYLAIPVLATAGLLVLIRPETLFYLDAPSFGNGGDYGAGVFSAADFERLSGLLEAIEGRLMMSINDTPELRELFARFTMRKSV